MPELPEVETVRRGLAAAASGLLVTGVEGVDVELRRPLRPAALAQALAGRRFAEPRRRGKFLLLDVADGGSLLVHLGMSGRLNLVGESAPRRPHTHLVLQLEEGRELHFSDPRRFGLIWWLGPGEEASDPSLCRLGMEPLVHDFPRLLPNLLRGRRCAVKTALLDQRLIAGIGNIYAAEALWRARIRPTRAAGSVSPMRLERLGRCVQEVLWEAIEQGGTTLKDFSRLDGGDGLFAVRLDAYGREGRPCSRCGTALRRSVIGGRSTMWCGACQR